MISFHERISEVTDCKMNLQQNHTLKSMNERIGGRGGCGITPPFPIQSQISAQLYEVYPRA